MTWALRGVQVNWILDKMMVPSLNKIVVMTALKFMLRKEKRMERRLRFLSHAGAL